MINFIQLQGRQILKGNSTSVKKIAKYLREQITGNILKSGVHLSEKVLAEEFKVSRVPVRESLRILQSEGYLEFIPNKGCFVKKLSRNTISETSIVYTILAPVVLKKAIPNYTVNTFKKAEIILDKIDKKKNSDGIGYLLWEFADVIYSPSQMKFMVRVFDSIYAVSIRLLNEFFESDKNAKFNSETHRKFISLCKEKKIDEAISLWSEYLLLLINRMNQKLLSGSGKNKVKIQKLI